MLYCDFDILIVLNSMIWRKKHDEIARIKVTLRCVHITAVIVEKQYVLHRLSVCVCLCVCVCVCVCRLDYPVCKAHASYYIVVCGLSGFTVFFHIISQKEDLSENVSEVKMYFDFLNKFVRNFFHSKNTQPRYNRKCT